MRFFWWTAVSALIVLGYQLLVGALVGNYLELQSWSGLNRWLVEQTLRLTGCFMAGLVVGVVSPGRRILEPALGALLAQGGLWLVGSPLWVWSAFPVTLAGAWLGERLSSRP